jgi:autotransporter-associated beta strand protein
VIPNASDGGVVGLTKRGTGQWVLSGNNTYTGETNASEGTLHINGNHTGGGPTTVAAGATLGGNGMLAGLLTNHGTLDPGAGVGTLTVNGDVNMAAGSRFSIELQGTTSDKLAVSGNLDLGAVNNSLDVVDLGKTGMSWVIATYTGSLTGQFESISAGYTVDYGTLSNSQITLNFAGTGGVPGDFNQNGVVDAADYVLWRNSVGPGSLPNEGGISPGTVDMADYDFWRSRFGATSGAGAGSVAQGVPEPVTVIMLCMAAFAMTGCWPRRSNHQSGRTTE